MYSYGMQRHRVFISFYHHDDQAYKDYIDKYLSRSIINTSVRLGEYATDISTEYIKRLIREDKVSGSSVIVVLVGPYTKHRMHVVWEIYAGLAGSINGNSGLIGIMLPTVECTPRGQYRYDDMPARLADNIKSGYAHLYTWDYAIGHFNEIIETAFNDRLSKKDLIQNSRLQMQRNTGG